MFSLEKELRELGAPEPVIDVERREVFSLYAELRIVTWVGVMLIATGVGIIVSKNLERIGPLTIAFALALAAAGCYAWAWHKRTREHNLVDDYILLLGALLLSADVGYIERQFDLLGSAWARHFLLLAIAHAVVAYLFDSRMVLSLSLTALAAWLGIEQRTVFHWDAEMSMRAFTCAAIVLGWRASDARYRGKRGFAEVFDHFAANLTFLGVLGLMAEDDTRWLGCLLGVVLAALCARIAWRRGSDAFLVYAWIYGLVSIDVLIVDGLNENTLAALYLVFSTIVAIVSLIVVRGRLPRRAA